ncbi:acyl-CoA dehydrogenase family protein [Micromonospora sp. WMMD961]|uniref:acyl-CoA dehydrogenase family protein n=1 Tax=Micromonospora sp. WMMD961 TaxID=3016100 RepID=UPI002417621A|nr:acyl-CoA dehydrogenase family protein [Micromonospora sp. WMMD961]MDG4782368.1 acyl-CoA dehydrogenase family protein [Micromonospora sp. WMMD961]
MTDTAAVRTDLAASVSAFIAERVIPVEPLLLAGGSPAVQAMTALNADARGAGLWALPLPAHLGGRGLDLGAYAPLAEVEGRSDFGPSALGSDLLLDALMLDRHATATVRDRYLLPMISGPGGPSFAMTEPGVAGSDPSALGTTATRDGDTWRVSGRKWFTSRAATAAFTTVVCRTAPDADNRNAFSLLVVPTDVAGYRIVRELPVLGAGGQYEIALDDVRVPADHLLGEPGQGLHIVGERLALGRTLRCLRWLGQAQRAHDLMLTRLTTRHAHGGPLSEQQLLHGLVFDSHADLAAARALTHAAVDALTNGGDTRIAVGTAKVVTARALCAIVDRATQVHGAEGLTDDTPLPMLARTARAARILDGPDELHITTVARRLLRRGH